MTQAPRRVRLIAVLLCALGTAACAAVPTPGRSEDPASPSATSRPVSASGAPRTASPMATPSSTPTTALGLGTELESQGALDESQIGNVLAYASTGSSIVFSSDLAGDAGPDAAPDLWSYAPGTSSEPELLWRNPDRTHTIASVRGDATTVAWVDMPIDGQRGWNLWVIEGSGEPVLLDTHPGDEDVSGLIPSLDVQESEVVWTSFDRGPSGPISQLLWAHAPDWEPTILAERLAADAELWLPSLRVGTLAYVEVRYAPDRLSDVRHVFLMELGTEAEPKQLDSSGQATMPLVVDGAVLWKQADRGFSMFNWGKMYRYDLGTGEVTRMSTTPQEYVNYPSAGYRFVAWWGADPSKFGVFDLKEGHTRYIANYPLEPGETVRNPYVHGDLMVWTWLATSQPFADWELRWAFLPMVKDIDR